jgi:DNA-directed RNA polymerase subunit H
MDYETLYILYQSRKTLLKILAGRGYNTAPYEKFGPVEISLMASVKDGDAAMRMDLEKEDQAAAAAPEEDGGATETKAITKCRVVYSFRGVKSRMASFMKELLEGEDPVDPATTEVVVIVVNDTIADAFHVAALSNYMNKKLRLRISFFQAKQLVNNPLEHVLVPKHELLPRAEHDAFLTANKIKSKANLPIIKFHEDMIARALGLVPGDIVKILRFSPSAGEYITYRVCAP